MITTKKKMWTFVACMIVGAMTAMAASFPCAEYESSMRKLIADKETAIMAQIQANPSLRDQLLASFEAWKTQKLSEMNSVLAAKGCITSEGTPPIQPPIVEPPNFSATPPTTVVPPTTVPPATVPPTSLPPTTKPPVVTPPVVTPPVTPPEITPPVPPVVLPPEVLPPPEVKPPKGDDGDNEPMPPTSGGAPCGPSDGDCKSIMKAYWKDLHAQGFKGQARKRKALEKAKELGCKFMSYHPGKKGDINGDGVIDYRDSKHLLRVLYDNDNESIRLKSCAEISDVNNDGKIDMSDAVKNNDNLQKAEKDKKDKKNK